MRVATRAGIILSVLLVVMLPGCGLIFGTDVGIIGMYVSDEGTFGPIEKVGFTVTAFMNGARNADFVIVLSSDNTIDVQTDYVVYRGTFSVSFNGTTDVEVTRPEMDEYVSANDVGVTVGSQYHVAIILDPDDELDDTLPSDNMEVAPGTFEW